VKPSVWCDRTMFLGPHYALVLSEKSFTKELKRLGIQPEDRPDYRPKQDATCYWLENDRGQPCYIVALRNWHGKDPVEVAALLVHEATHIKQRVMSVIGEDEPSAEFEAYMMQNIAGNLMQSFVAQTGGKNEKK